MLVFLEYDVPLIEEVNSLEWICITEILQIRTICGNIKHCHIVEVAKMFDLSQEEDEQILDKGIFVGVTDEKWLDNCFN
jgi:hypothetical protein